MDRMNSRKNRSHKINEEMLVDYRHFLINSEHSAATVDKYMHDLNAFVIYTDGKDFDKETVIAYKRMLCEDHTACSVNVMLAALNGFFRFAGWNDCMVKNLKVQRETFRMDNRTLSKEEYKRLLDTARKRGNIRLEMMMETMASTGIRVSELKFITVEAVRNGCAVVNLKGKSRSVLLPKALCQLLYDYIKKKDIRSGSIFITRSGRPVDRSNIWREMKELYEEAKVDKNKVFPHNLRHLFACVYYKAEKNIVNLADILGHSSVNTTRIYTSVSRKEQSRRIESLGLVI